MSSAKIVWRRILPGERRYPYLRVDVSWPQTASAADPNFQRTTERLFRLFSGGSEAFTPYADPGTGPSTWNHALSSLLIHIARRLDSAIRDALAELHRIAPSQAAPDWIEFPIVDEFLGFDVVKAAHRLILSALASPNSEHKLEAWLKHEVGRIKSEISQHYPSEPIVSLLVQARLRGIPCKRISRLLSIYGFGHGARQKQIWKGYSDATSYLGVVTSTNKTVAHELLSRAGIPVPRQWTVDSWENAKRAAADIGFPVVVKPQTTDFGTAVTTGIVSEYQLRQAFDEARKHGGVLIERHIAGDDYRILVVNGKALRAYKRIPAHIVGNGVNTVAELIDMTTAERKKVRELRSYSFARKDDPQVLAMLQKQGLSLSAVPKRGVAVVLRSNANVSTGGTTVSVANVIHPDNLRLAERAALALGIDIAGIDLISPDISVTWLENGAAICEVNPTPGMPYAEDAKRVLDFLTEDGRTDLRVPVILFVGPNDEASACQDRLEILTRDLSMTLTTVRANTVFQDGRQISQRCPTWKIATEIASLDRSTDVLLLCHDSPDVGELPVSIDVFDLALVSQTGYAASSAHERQTLTEMSLIVMEGDDIQFWKQCRLLIQEAKLRDQIVP